eukprot:CAMPEP_0198290588 /NCGR_PEP_ID=MMETSP1449-20131203/8391_1 /TAXON_ID=420275 /ORGANISM="Attheya septentrionalis, Strain CCMP2084" /LENGTH=665 /DNA_ID=CAMNT_0043989103 /DNA_START=10 /DNA_END=2010 /DNA_ORIENTATION=-
MTEPATQRARVVEAYAYDGLAQDDLWEVLKDGCGKGTLMDRAAYKGPTLDSIKATETPPLAVPPDDSEAHIKLTRIPRTSPPELYRNFKFGIDDVAVTPNIRNGIDHVNETFLASGGFPVFLRGPGGVGKTTGLVAIAQLIQDKGCMSVFIQLKGLATGAPSSYVVAWAKNCLHDCRATFGDDESNPWKHIRVSRRYLPNVSCFDLLAFLSEGDLADAESLFGLGILFRSLSVESFLPVALFLDQWNAMEKDYWTDGKNTYTKGSHPVGSIFANWEQRRKPVIFQSLSSSCQADFAPGSDGNGTICQQTVKVWPVHTYRWLLQNIRGLASDAIPFSESEMDAIAALCGSLPREMIRYCVDAKGDKDNYLQAAVTHFRIRVSGLMHRDSEESLRFSAYVYMHHVDWNNMPSAWAVAGVLHEPTPRHWAWVCEAAKTGFFTAFMESSESYSGVYAALSIFANVVPTHDQALELAMIHYFNRFRKFAPGISYTDMQGKTRGSLVNLSFDVPKIEFIKKEDRDKLTELVEGTAYILWEGAAVVDFFVYHSAKAYAWIQLSKSQYSAHPTKADDMFSPAPNYPINPDVRNQTHHSPYSYFRNLIKKDQERNRTTFDATEYYFYITPNKPNPQRQLTACEENNCFLISGESFKNLLGHGISNAIAPVFEGL